MELQARNPTTKGSAEWLTGEVWIDAIAQTHGPSPMSIGSVHFAPGRTHRLAQPLDRPDPVCDRGGRPRPAPRRAIVTIRHGDVVYIPGGEWHWHGAAPDTS